MLSIPGSGPIRKCCDGWSRREFMRVGAMGLAGLSLPEFFSLKARAATSSLQGATGFGRAKSVILCFLQGGPSHLDIWDPKPDAPSNIRGEFKPIKTNVDGVLLSETMPLLAKQMDKCMLIRSMSYTPAGLFNHTAAIYQMLTGWTPDKVSPSGQLEPPSPRDYPNFGSQIIRIKPPEVPMLPFVMLPRPLQESNVVGKAGTAGFLGRAYDPYYFYQDPNKEIKLDDLTLRPEVSSVRLQRRATLQKTLEDGMPVIEKAVENYALDKYYTKAYDLI